MANNDIVTSQMVSPDCHWRALTQTLADEVEILGGATFTTDPLFIVDNGYESLHVIVAGTDVSLEVNYECDNSNVDANFAVPYVAGDNISVLRTALTAGTTFDGISLAPSMRKRFNFVNSGTGTATVSCFLNMVLKNE